MVFWPDSVCDGPRSASRSKTIIKWWSRPAALACRLSAVGLLRVATGDGQPTPCIIPNLLCWVLGVPGQDAEGSWSPAEVGVSVEDEEEEEDEGEQKSVMSTASLRGCSWRMESWEMTGRQRRSRLQCSSSLSALQLTRWLFFASGASSTVVISKQSYADFHKILCCVVQYFLTPSC